MEVKKKEKKNKKEEIISNAISLFYEFGYTGCTLRMIAKESHVTHVTIFKHFKNKYELASILIDRYLNGLVSITRKFIQEKQIKGEDKFDNMLFYLCVHYELLKRDQNFFKFYIEYYHIDSQSFVESHYRHLQDIINNTFKIEYNKPDIYIKLDNYSITGVGLELLELYNKNEFTLVEVIEYSCSLLMRLIDDRETITKDEIEKFICCTLKNTDYLSYDIFRDFLSNSTLV